MLGIRRLTAVLLFLRAGCGGGGSTAPPPPAPSFSLSVSPSSLLVAQTTSVAITVTALPNNGFTNSVTVTITGLPTGVTSSPNATFKLAAGTSQKLTFAVGPTVGRANYAVTFSGTSGILSASAALSLTVSGAPLTAATGNYVQELGNGVQNTSLAVGPLLASPSANSSRFINASVPTGAQLQFTFFQVLPNGSTIPEGISHLYGVPNSGVGTSSVNW